MQLTMHPPEVRLFAALFELVLRGDYAPMPATLADPPQMISFTVL